MSRRSYFKYKNNVIIVPHQLWFHSGGSLIQWFEENMPNHEFTINFCKDERGKIIPFKPVQFVFDNPDASMLFKLLGYERWRNPYE
jgi:hypothetical protein